MARLALLTLVALGLAACSQNEVGKKVITEQCIAEGETVEVCECFAKTSDEKLDKELFDIVVLGAQGEDIETAERIEELTRKGDFNKVAELQYGQLPALEVVGRRGPGGLRQQPPGQCPTPCRPCCHARCLPSIPWGLNSEIHATAPDQAGRPAVPASGVGAGLFELAVQAGQPDAQALRCQAAVAAGFSSDTSTSW